MPLFKRGCGHFFGIVLLAGVLTACATTPNSDPGSPADEVSANDPLELPNRFIFAFNVGLDQLVLQPAAVTYRDLMPDELKVPIRNLITNLFMPLSFLHAMLQGDFDRAEQAASRFFASAPALFLSNPDPGRTPVYEDAGQTFAVWGASAGPYIMLPVLGPSNLRDTAGTIIDFFIDPLGIVAGSEATIGRGISSAVLQRSRNIEQVRDLQRNSVDYYAAVRSLYGQRREAEIKNGDLEPTRAAPTIGLELDAAPAPKQSSDATKQ
ncbi:MAG: VacJ family lipoprotein [Alphaproteobacteria bacterium]|nr:VacJ family lipoprotein [Alphaproteobacteria bacterium]